MSKAFFGEESGVENSDGIAGGLAGDAAVNSLNDGNAEVCHQKSDNRGQEEGFQGDFAETEPMFCHKYNEIIA